jgi:GNAT superfamily N-acetyltransferase
MSGESEEQPILSAPECLAEKHELEPFNCGVASLDEWLKRRAWHNEQEGASRTYVVCAGQRVVGYYCLAAGSVWCADVPGRVRRRMPDPIPVMIIGRLAVDQGFQGRGLGRALLADAVLRTLNVAEIAGVRAILVQAISEEAKRFYQSCGFVESPTNPMTLVVTLKDVKGALGL